MVAVVSGSGLGLFTSGSVSGNANTGRGGERVFVNTATGNLVVQGADDSLTARGLDFVALRTYNSQGLLDDDNGDNWRLGADQRLSTLTGTVNTSGSTITKHFGDGARVVYTYNVARSRYESNEGGGAHDYLTYSAGTWTWTDGSGRNTETYDASLRIATSADIDGNTITYTFTGSVLTRLDMAGSTAQTVFFDYTGTNLSAIRVVSDGATQTLTRYTYDSANRLETVTVDLTPDNVADSVTYATTYTYDGTSRRIASIMQSDGSSVAFTYVQTNGDYRVSTVTDGEGRVSTLTYTDVTGSGTTATANANSGVLSTQGTVNYPRNEGVLSTTGTQTNYYNRNEGALTQTGWVAEGTLESSATSASNSRIGYLDNGDAWAAWSQGNFVYVRRYIASTNTWSTAVQMTGDSGAGAVGTVKLAVDGVTGSALVAWVQDLSGDDYAWSAYLDGATGVWTTPQWLDSESDAGTVGTSEDDLSVAVSGTQAAVIFTGIADGSRNVYLSVYSEGVEYGPDVMDGLASDAGQPSVAIDGAGNVITVWRQTPSGGSPRVYYNRYDSSATTYSGPQLLDTNADGSFLPSIVTDGNGNMFALWRQTGGLHVRRFSASTETWGSAVALQSVVERPPPVFAWPPIPRGTSLSDGHRATAPRIPCMPTSTRFRAALGAARSFSRPMRRRCPANDHVSVSISGTRAVARVAAI